MRAQTVLAATAGLSVIFGSITPVWSYFPSDFQTNTSSQVSQGNSQSISTHFSSKSAISASSTSMSKTSSARSSTTFSASAKVQCYLNAVDKRESAVITSFETYRDFMMNVLDLRKKLLLKYWTQTDTKVRDQNLRTVWRTFGQAWRKQGISMRQERRDAWKRYRLEMSACGMYPDNDPDKAGLGADSQL